MLVFASLHLYKAHKYYNGAEKAVDFYVEISEEEYNQTETRLATIEKQEDTVESDNTDKSKNVETFEIPPFVFLIGLISVILLMEICS